MNARKPRNFPYILCSTVLRKSLSLGSSLSNSSKSWKKRKDQMIHSWSTIHWVTITMHETIMIDRYKNSICNVFTRQYTDLLSALTTEAFHNKHNYIRNESNSTFTSQSFMKYYDLFGAWHIQPRIIFHIRTNYANYHRVHWCFCTRFYFTNLSFILQRMTHL